jgi:hypothetical protein
MKNGQSDSQAILGVDSQAIWCPGDFAVGPLVDKVAAAQLATVSTPQFGQVFDGLPNDPLAVQFDSDLDGFAAGSAAVADPGAHASWLVLVALRFTAVPASNNRYDIVSRDGPVNNGWYFVIRDDFFGTGNFEFNGYINGDGGADIIAQITATPFDANPHYFAIWHHFGNAQQGVSSDVGTWFSAVDIGGMTPPATVRFRIGDALAYVAGRIKQSLVVALDGVRAETIIDDINGPNLILPDWWAM